MHEDMELVIRRAFDDLRKDTADILSGIVETPMEYHTPAEGYSLPEGMVMRTHPRSRCAGDFCSVHNPSDHPLKDAPRNWRSDRGLMERICPCGTNHPDPDDIEFTRRIRGDRAAHIRSIHGCCPETCCGNSAFIIEGDFSIERWEIEG